MTPLVRLEDARGCWKVVPHADLILVTPETVRLTGAAWKHLPFTLFSNDGAMPVYRANRAALGDVSQPFIGRLHLPDGWHAPKDPK